MSEAKLFFFNKPDPSRPIENKYVTEVEGIRESFIRKEEAMLHLFDNGIRSFKFLTKEEKDYIDVSKVPTYEFWHIGNRLGYVFYDFEPYVDENNEVQKKRAFVWRFVGFGRSCFAPTQEKLKEKVRALIYEYQKDPEEVGYNTYPFYTRYYRESLQSNSIDRTGIDFDFIVIDFEIANSNLNSACSMGIAIVDDNQIVDKKHYYIRPPTLTFESKMVEIHKITAEHVKDAKYFNEIWEEIKSLFNEPNTIIAHNAQFDMSVLNACLNEYNLPLPDFTYIDSLPISTRACRGQNVGNSLKKRLDFFGIPLDNHHNALADAVATTQLVLHCIELKNRKSLKSYCRTYPSIPIKRFSELKPSKTFGKKGKSFNHVRVNEIAATVENFDETHIFFGKYVVFTGELQSIDRKAAMQKVVDLGGILTSGVSRKTNYLIVGKQDKTLVGEDGLSTKEEKAYALNEQGIDIKILNEEDFLKLTDV